LGSEKFNGGSFVRFAIGNIPVSLKIEGELGQKFAFLLVRFFHLLYWWTKIGARSELFP
jgi:hypothetical protein